MRLYSAHARLFLYISNNPAQAQNKSHFSAPGQLRIACNSTTSDLTRIFIGSTHLPDGATIKHYRKEKNRSNKSEFLKQSTNDYKYLSLFMLVSWILIIIDDEQIIKIITLDIHSSAAADPELGQEKGQKIFLKIFP